MLRDRAIVFGAGEGRQYALGSSLRLCFKADDPEAEGRYSISVATAGANHPGTTPHVHREHDDLFFVIDGTLSFEVADDTFEAPAGALVVVPQGLTHRWWNAKAEPVNFLNLHILGAGFESFVRELAHLSAEGHASPAAMIELGARYDEHFDEHALESRYSS